MQTYIYQMNNNKVTTYVYSSRRCYQTNAEASQHSSKQHHLIILSKSNKTPGQHPYRWTQHQSRSTAQQLH